MYHLSDSESAYLSSCFWGSITLGRLLSGIKTPLIKLQAILLLCLSHEKVTTHSTPFKWWFVVCLKLKCACACLCFRRGVEAHVFGRVIYTGPIAFRYLNILIPFILLPCCEV